MTESRRGAGQAPDPDILVTAAVLCWEDDRNDDVIAAALGVSRRTLVRWKRRPEYRAAYDALYLHWLRALYRRDGVALPERLGPGPGARRGSGR